MIAARRKIAVGQHGKIKIWAVTYSSVFLPPCRGCFGGKELDVVEVLIAVVEKKTFPAHGAHALDHGVDVRQFAFLPALRLVERPKIHRLVESRNVNWHQRGEPADGAAEANHVFDIAEIVPLEYAAE